MARLDLDMDMSWASASFGAPMHEAGAIHDSCEILRDIVDRMQMAPCGNAELDAQIDQAIASLGGVAGDSWMWVYMSGKGMGWSSDLGQSLSLVPEGYNFSLGHRDGIYWAWIQPNDRWDPGENESRHDHPHGSGLLVAYTAALALTAAALTLWIRRMDQAELDTLSRASLGLHAP